MVIDITDRDYSMKTAILAALHEVHDPELGINVVDLGLVYNILIDRETSTVTIEMTLSTPSCPLGGFIIGHVKVATEEVAASHQVSVNLVWEPKWSYDMLTPTGKAALDL